MLIIDKSAVAGIGTLTPAQIIGLNVLDNLDSAKQLNGSTLTAVGFGNPALLNVGSNNAGGPMPYSNDATRRVGYETIININSQHVQSSMNPIHNDSGTCFGDSDGPQFLNGVIATLTSTGDMVCRASDKSYRLDIQASQNFLNCVFDPSKSIADLKKCGTSN